MKLSVWGFFEVADYKSDVRIIKFKKAKVYKVNTSGWTVHSVASLVLGYAERENNFVILISESQSAIPKIPVSQVS